MVPKRVTICWLALLVATFVSAAGWVLSAAAQTRHTPAAASAGTIANIRIEGIQRIEPETIRSYLLVQPGDPWDPERIDRSLKALFNTGLFADVKLDGRHFERLEVTSSEQQRNLLALVQACLTKSPV